MTVTEFAGATLPEGWTAQAPPGSSVDMSGEYLQLTILPGQSFNSLHSGNNVPEGPLVWRAVNGAFDFAVGLAEEACNLPNQGLDLLALDESGSGGARFANYSGAQNSTFRNDISWYIWSTGRGQVTNSTGDALMNGLYGGPGWLRLAYDGEGNYVCYASHTGRSGSWHTIGSFTTSFVPTRFAIHATATPSGVDGRVQRIARVVDLLARGSDDATTEPPEAVRRTLHTYDGGALPEWLTVDTAHGGTVTVDESGAELAVTGDNLSHAWLIGPDDLPRDHGMVVEYQVTQTGAVNHFWVPALSVDTSTDIPGARTPDDKWGNGTCLLLEMPARIHATDGRLVRVLRKSPNAAGETQTGNREFDGFTLLAQDTDAPVTTVGAPVTRLRMERHEGLLRVRLWYATDPEPEEWTYELEDWMRCGTGVVWTLAHNDGFAGSSAVRLSHIELYELDSDPDPDPDPDTIHAGFPYGQTVVRLRAPLVEDRYGSMIRDWSDPDAIERLTYTGVGVAPRFRDEDLAAGRQGIVTGLALYLLLSDVDIHPHDRLELGEDVYEVVGEIANWCNPFTGWYPGVVVNIERMEG